MLTKPQIGIVKMRADYFAHDERGEYHVAHEYFVYRGEKLVRVCPSEGMAREVAAGLS